MQYILYLLHCTMRSLIVIAQNRRLIGLHTSFPDRRRTCLHICDSATDETFCENRQYWFENIFDKYTYRKNLPEYFRTSEYSGKSVTVPSILRA